MIDLSDKVILVTGGARGIGAGISQTLARAGASLVLHYNRGKSEAEKMAAEIGVERCQLVQADLMEAEAPIALWQAAIDWQGRVDVLVNNAAIRPPAAIDASFEDWDKAWMDTMRVNLVAPAHLCRLAMAHFKTRGGGTIINLSSRPAFRGDRPDFLHDGAAKGGLTSLTRGIARWFASDEVIAFVVVPGIVLSGQTDNFLNLYGYDEMIADIPLGDAGQPEDVGNVVAFLASGLARYSTGATIDIGGASYLH